MNNQILNMINSNPKIKYGLALVVLPIIVVISLLHGGSLGDVFSQKTSSRETRQIVQTEINGKKSLYGFQVATASDIKCKDKLNNKYNTTIDCSVNASRIVGGSIQGPVDITVRVQSVSTDTSPMRVVIQNIQPAK